MKSPPSRHILHYSQGGRNRFVTTYYTILFMLLHNSEGNYSFLRGGAPYSAGVVASEGFTVEHVRLTSSMSWRAGFDAVSQHLQAAGRPRAALCGVELRSPAPLTFDGFREFNAGYADLLKSWNVFVDGVNPIARTNVAPELDPPVEPSVYAFSYTVPSPSAGPSFVVAGAGELPDNTTDLNAIIRRGETSPDAVEEKARFVLDLLQKRLFGLGMAWKDVTATNAYTVLDLNAALRSEVLARLDRGARHGVTWYYSRPPIAELEFEMDVRACARELVLSLG